MLKLTLKRVFQCCCQTINYSKLQVEENTTLLALGGSFYVSFTCLVGAYEETRIKQAQELSHKKFEMHFSQVIIISGKTYSEQTWINVEEVFAK